MENPATWGEVERLIDGVLRDDQKEALKGQFVCGLSMARRIADALREAGLL